MPMKRMPDSGEINLEHVDEAKAADKVSNSNHNKEASNGKKKGDQKINDTTKGQNSTYTNNQCNHSVNGSIYGAPSTSVEVKATRPGMKIVVL
ncbi:hypothetical protein JHK82_023926 [Glycine max]|nr:hypothetical protein JHK82_023926 [Glycine max]